MHLNLKRMVFLVAVFVCICIIGKLALGQEVRKITNSYVGCTDKKYFKRLISYAAQHDDAAFQKALYIGVAAGICTVFKPGEAVYVSDTSLFSGLVKLRRPGEVKEYWTVMEAIFSNNSK